MSTIKTLPPPPPPPPPKPQPAAPKHAAPHPASGFSAQSSFSQSAPALAHGPHHPPVIQADALSPTAPAATLAGPAAQNLMLNVHLAQLGGPSATVAMASPSYDAGAVTRELSRFDYAPEGAGTLGATSIAAMAINGGRPDFGADGKFLNCIQGAVYAQTLFAQQHPPVETELVVGTNGHAVLRMPDGEYYDPERAMNGEDPFVPEDQKQLYDGIDGVTPQERAALDRTAKLAYASARAAGASEAQARQAASDAVLRAAGPGRLDEASALTRANGEVDVVLPDTISAEGEWRNFTVGTYTTVSHDHDKSEPFPTPEGGESVTYTMDTEVKFGVTGEVEAGAVSVGADTYAGVRFSYELSVPSDQAEVVDAQIAAGQAPNPIDPMSVPVGGSVLITQEALSGTEFSGGLGALAVSAGQESSEGWSFGTTRTSDTTVQVVSGPTESVRGSVFLGAEIGPLSFGFGGETEVRNTQLQMVEFDVSGPEGQAVYQSYLKTGKLPEPLPTYPDGRPIVINSGTIDQVDVNSATRLEATVGGFGISIGGREETMQSRTTQLKNGTTVEEAYWTNGEAALHIGSSYDTEGNVIDGPTYTIMFDDVGEQSVGGFPELFPPGSAVDANGNPIPAGSAADGDQIVTVTYTEAELIQLRDQARAYIANGGENADDPRIVALANAETPGEVAIALATQSDTGEEGVEILMTLSLYTNGRSGDSVPVPLPGKLSLRDSSG